MSQGSTSPNNVSWFDRKTGIKGETNQTNKQIYIYIWEEEMSFVDVVTLEAPCQGHVAINMTWSGRRNTWAVFQVNLQ